MDNNSLLIIVLAFILGFMASGMMKSMCGGRLVEEIMLLVTAVMKMMQVVIANLIPSVIATMVL